jgi:DNA-binding LacI/PurR family transcriptional regulator
VGTRRTSALLALDERPTAIVAASDLMALARSQAIRDAGLAAGADVAVIGFDDIEGAALAHTAADDDPPGPGKARHRRRGGARWS